MYVREGCSFSQRIIAWSTMLNGIFLLFTVCSFTVGSLSLLAWRLGEGKRFQCKSPKNVHHATFLSQNSRQSASKWWTNTTFTPTLACTCVYFKVQVNSPRIGFLFVCFFSHSGSQMCWKTGDSKKKQKTAWRPETMLWWMLFYVSWDGNEV